MAAGKYRTRIKELRWVPAGELRAHPENWRRHPPEQRAALERVLEAIGWAGALTARELEDGSLELTDGHLRSDVGAGELVPVLVTDLEPEEARTMLLATDPIAMMAEADAALLEQLMAQADPSILAGVEATLSKLLWQANAAARGVELPQLGGGDAEMQTITVYYPAEVMEEVKSELDRHEGSTVSEKFLALVRARARD